MSLYAPLKPMRLLSTALKCRTSHIYARKPLFSTELGTNPANLRSRAIVQLSQQQQQQQQQQQRAFFGSSPKHNDSSKMSVDTLKPSDRQAWEVIFRKYIDFYQTTLPDEQYQNAWERIMDPKGDIEALVVRGENGELLGLAHYLWMGTPWRQEMICNLNDLYVEKSTRGKGYGTVLIKAVKDRAAEKGCFRLRWATKHDNPARKLYDTLATTEFVEYRTPIP